MNLASLWYLESTNLYKILCPHKVKEMAFRHEFVVFEKGRAIYLPGAVSTHIYLIVEGRVKIGHYGDTKDEIISAILTKGEIFGELGLAGENVRRDFVIPVVNTTICIITLDNLKKLMYENKELSFKILKLIGLRLMKLERKLELLVFKDARTRVVEFLKDAAEWKGRKAGYETVIHTNLTHKDISLLTGTSRQTVTTILNELRDQNAIAFNRRNILIRDLPNLK
ncbi:MAG: Crp/Fnr family transcriptional regulator [Chryseolinea sp.]